MADKELTRPSGGHLDDAESPQVAGRRPAASQADDLPSVDRVVGRNTEKQTFASWTQMADCGRHSSVRCSALFRHVGWKIQWRDPTDTVEKGGETNLKRFS